MYNCVHVQLIISVTDFRYSAQILLENAFLCRQNARVKNHLFYSKFCRQNLFKPIHLKTRKKAGKHGRPHWFGERQQSHSVCFTAEFMGTDTYAMDNFLRLFERAGNGKSLNWFLCTWQAIKKNSALAQVFVFESLQYCGFSLSPANPFFKRS